MSTLSLEEAIQSSFLPEVVKKELLRYGARVGWDIRAFDRFQGALLVDLEERKQKELKAEQGFDVTSQELMETHEAQQAAQRKILEEVLSTLDPTDIVGREKAWDAYYAAMDTLQSQTHMQIQGLVQQTIRQATI